MCVNMTSAGLTSRLLCSAPRQQSAPCSAFDGWAFSGLIKEVLYSNSGGREGGADDLFKSQRAGDEKQQQNSNH